MTPEQAVELRKPFGHESIGKLPRVWCKACRDSQSKNCQQHQKIRCDVCGNTITKAHLHLDYVGHAEITDRLLIVDPGWTWEPVAFGQDGLPQITREGLWIRLTVAGVTRLGFGSADGKTGPDAVKEMIGDALRNAAMRFGVGLDLWGAKYKGGEDGQHDTVEQAPAPERWDPGEQQTLRDGWETEIDHATDLKTIAEIGLRLIEAKQKESISPETYEYLAVYGRRRRDELAQMQRNEQREPDSLPIPADSNPPSDKQTRRMHATFRELGIDKSEDKYRFMSDVLKREIASSRELSAQDVDAVIVEQDKRKRHLAKAVADA